MPTIEHYRSEIYLIDNNKILLGRNPKNGIFEIPGGHIEKHENPQIAAIREAKEEVAIRVLGIMKIDVVGNDINAIIHAFISNNFVVDKSLFGSEPDMLERVWFEYRDAIQMLKTQLELSDEPYHRLINEHGIDVIMNIENNGYTRELNYINKDITTEINKKLK
jgi:8-oxo-dGTP pyrophosphatase MutT (NUDIX family)